MKGKYWEELKRQVMEPLEETVRQLREGWLNPITEEKPQKLLNKRYDELTMEDIAQLMAIYHKPGEAIPCKFCQMMAKEEMRRWTRG